MTDVGRRIAELRLAAGHTQESFARALGTSPQYAQRLEAGLNLTLHSLVKVANALSVPVSALLEPTAHRRPTRAGRPPKVAAATRRRS